MKTTLILLVTAVLFIFLGCCIQIKYEFYEFNVVEHNFDWGSASSGLLPSVYNSYSGLPYELFIVAYCYDDLKVTSVVASNISVHIEDNLESIWQSDDEYPIGSDLSGTMRVKMPKGKVAVRYFDIRIVSLELPYKPVTIKATLRLESDEGVIEEVVEYKLEPEYRIKRNSFFSYCIQT